jgi:deazaflavin-dependent oxidoreductase (nitroreductase family)
MTSAMTQRKRRADWFHRYLANPISVRLPTQVVLETTGRKTGLPRRTPVGGRIVNQQFWMVAGDGETADYVRNIQAHNVVRLRIKGHWRRGTAVLLPDDDAVLRLTQLPRFNSAMVRALGTKPLTVRVDLG